jgi:IS1 family transposase
MNILTTEKRAAILTALSEGSGVNSTARMLSCSKVTVLRLLNDAATVCERWHDQHVRGLQAERIQLDETWSFVGGKDRTRKAGANVVGSVWTWLGLDSDSKLVISYRLGAREQADADSFVRDLASRLANRPQISTDGLRYYETALVRSFLFNVDFAQVIKEFANPPRDAATRYSPGICISCEKVRVIGDPIEEDISTSHVERLNLSLRLSCKRYARLTMGFSRRYQNHLAALHLALFSYNWVKRHSSLKTTPAVASGIAGRPMQMIELVERIEAEEKAVGGRLTEYLPSPKSES